MRLFDFFDKTCESNPSAPAVLYEGRIWSYGEIQSLSRKLAAALMALGLPSGSKIATWLPNSPLFFVAQIAIHRTPNVWMPLNPRATAEECAENMAAFGAEFLLIDESFFENVALLRARVPSLRGLIGVGAPLDDGPELLDWIAQYDDRLPDVDIRPDDVVTLLTTGGSTGRPKGVMRISRNWSMLIANYRIALPYTAPPVNLVATPLTHVAGEVAQAIFAQGGVNVIASKPTPEVLVAAIAQHRVTTMFLPPTLVYALLAHPGIRDADFSSLRYLKYGAAPMSIEKLREAWSVFGPVMTQLYGLMEATSTVCIMPPADHANALAVNPSRLSSCGRGSPYVMVGVMDEEGRMLPAGERGEVVVRSDSLMRGYEANPEATAAAIRDGWFHTGDIGFKDTEGFLHLVDRSKDIIISGGFNIYPGEIEQVIWTHPAVQDCAVIGVPDDKWGEAVTAVIELKPGALPDAAMEEEGLRRELLAICRESLGSIKAPKSIVIWPTLPRSNVGKVLKKDIRAHYWQSMQRNI